MFRSYSQSRSSRKTGRLFASLALIAGMLFTVVPAASAAVKSATQNCSELSNFTADLKKAPPSRTSQQTEGDMADAATADEPTSDEAVAAVEDNSSTVPTRSDGSTSPEEDSTPPAGANADESRTPVVTDPSEVGAGPSQGSGRPRADEGSTPRTGGRNETSTATPPGTKDSASDAGEESTDAPVMAPTRPTRPATQEAPAVEAPAPATEGAADTDTDTANTDTDTAPVPTESPVTHELTGDGTDEHPYVSETPAPSTQGPETRGPFNKPCKEVTTTETEPTTSTGSTPPVPAVPGTSTDSSPAADRPSQPQVTTETPQHVQPPKPVQEKPKPVVAVPEVSGGQSADAPQVTRPRETHVVPPAAPAKPATVTATAETNRTPVVPKTAPKPVSNVSVNGGAAAAPANVEQPAKPAVPEPVVVTSRAKAEKTITVASATEISLEKVCRLEGGSGWKLKYHNKGDKPEPLHVLQAQKTTLDEVDSGLFATNINSFASLLDVKPGESGEKQFTFKNIVAYGNYVDIDIAQDDLGTRLIKHDNFKNDCMEKPQVELTGECQTSAGQGTILTFSNKGNQTEKFTVTRDGKVVDGSPFEMKAGSENVRKFLPVNGETAIIKVTNGKGFVFEKSLKFDCKANVATVLDTGTTGGAVPTGPAVPTAMATANPAKASPVVAAEAAKVSVDAGQATTTKINAEASAKTDLAKTGMEVGRFLLVAGGLVALGMLALSIRRARTASRS